MTGLVTQPISKHRAVRWWLVSIAALIAIMVLVGGATRLTESGLSIVEWKPVRGVLPPLDAEQWTQAFEGYKAIPQYRELNAGMTLAEFKTIFWWEWSHRLLGRVIGIAYLLPFLWFLWRGELGAELDEAEISAEAGNGFELIQSAAGVAERAAGDHGHDDAGGGGQRRSDQAGFVAHAAGGVLIDGDFAKVRGIELFAGVAHGEGESPDLIE